MADNKGKKSKDFSRRDFLKNAGLLAGSAAIGSTFLAGLNPETAKAASNAYTSSMPEWDYETEVLIVGTGIAGLCAAIAATQAGAKVTMLEKHSTSIGGNSIICGGSVEFAGVDIQAKQGIKDSADLFYADTMALGEYRCDPDLLRIYADAGQEQVDWLAKAGLTFTDAITKWPGNSVARGLTMNGGGSGGIGALLNWVKNANIPILTGHKLLGIVREEQFSGRVRGIKVQTPQGVKYFKGSKAVILASGGWKGNLQMRTTWDPRSTGELTASGEPWVETTGEGILAAVEIGAGLRDMSFVGEYRRKLGVQYYQAPSPAGLTVKDYNDIIFVNKLGKRYCDETTPASEAADPYFKIHVDTPENKTSYVIFDNDAVTRNKWVIDNKHMDDGYFFSASSLEELAGLINVPADALKATVEKYNTFAGGKDADFGKPAPKAIKTGPFYAVSIRVYCHDQGGGIHINTKAQVLDVWGNVIDGLYAAGEATGGYFGSDRGHGKIGVHSVFGRIAGAYAAQ